MNAPLAQSTFSQSAGHPEVAACVSPSSGLEDEVGVGGAFRVLVARPALPIGVCLSRTLGKGLHHLCNIQRKQFI